LFWIAVGQAEGSGVSKITFGGSPGISITARKAGTSLGYQPDLSHLILTPILQ